jgi:hypothetical protein
MGETGCVLLGDLCRSSLGLWGLKVMSHPATKSKRSKNIVKHTSLGASDSSQGNGHVHVPHCRPGTAVSRIHTRLHTAQLPAMGQWAIYAVPSLGSMAGICPVIYWTARATAINMITSLLHTISIQDVLPSHNTSWASLSLSLPAHWPWSPTLLITVNNMMAFPRLGAADSIAWRGARNVYDWLCLVLISRS